jgi:hypothetical protein
MNHRRRHRRQIVLPSGRYRVLGERRSAAAAARAAHATGQRWTIAGGRFLVIAPADPSEGGAS